MVQEASLAEQIETKGYHLREAQTTLDFSKKQNAVVGQGNNGQKLIKSSGTNEPAHCHPEGKSNPANSQYILFVEAQLDGLSRQ
jgi:hypothetical protein